jgi:hypothetical protein
MGRLALHPSAQSWRLTIVWDVMTSLKHRSNVTVAVVCFEKMGGNDAWDGM